MDLDGNMCKTNAKTTIIIMPIKKVGTLILNIADAEVNLSRNDPILLAEYDPRYRPISMIMTVDVVNSNTVLGNFSVIMLLTFWEPESLVKKSALPRSNVIVLNNFIPRDFGEYHASSSPCA
jgi:hypothetical protein